MLVGDRLKKHGHCFRKHVRITSVSYSNVNDVCLAAAVHSVRQAHSHRPSYKPGDQLPVASKSTVHSFAASAAASYCFKLVGKSSYLWPPDGPNVDQLPCRTLVIAEASIYRWTAEKKVQHRQEIQVVPCRGSRLIRLPAIRNNSSSSGAAGR